MVKWVFTLVVPTAWRNWEVAMGRFLAFGMVFRFGPFIPIAKIQGGIFHAVGFLGWNPFFSSKTRNLHLKTENLEWNQNSWHIGPNWQFNEPSKNEVAVISNGSNGFWSFKVSELGNVSEVDVYGDIVIRNARYTVDARNLAPPAIYETPWRWYIHGYSSYQLATSRL